MERNIRKDILFKILIKKKMGENMHIRQIDINDAEKFLELSKKIDESNFMLYEPGERTTTIDEQREILKGIVGDPQSIIFVAEVNGSLVGFIKAFGGKVNRNKHSAYLVLGVLSEFQGQGIATKLFHEIFIWAKEKQMTRLELTVIKNNMKALNLYKKMGFVVEGEKVHSLMINGSPVNEYYLFKLL